MAEKDDRIRCRYCGSNNFAGTTTCWQCNRPLVSSVDQPQPVSMVSQHSPASDFQPIFKTNFDEKAGNTAAITLGLLFPLFGYPIGLAFIMLDDQRKVQLGKLAIAWSTVGLVLSIILTLLSIAPIVSAVKAFAPSGDLQHSVLPTDNN